MRGRYQIKKVRFSYDVWLLFPVLLLMALGILMVGSASMVLADKQYNFPFYFLIKQCVFLMIGLLIAWCVTRVPTAIMKKYSGYLVLFSIGLLVIVLIPNIGRTVNGSRRWLSIGITSIQVSEIAKLFSILYLSSYLCRYQNQVRERIQGFVKPVCVLCVIGFLLLLEPDFGSLTVIAIVFFSLLFIAGARLLPFTLLSIMAMMSMSALAIFTPYRLLRLTTFMNPWEHAFGAGYQLTQSLIAFGRGGFFGVGLGNSVQKLFYLPEAHSDFIFAVVGEELGFVGELFLIGLFILIITRMIAIAHAAKQAKMDYGYYVTLGIAFWLAWQALINMGVSVGMLPTKGLTLPFISYGGSSMVMVCIAMGIVLRIAFEAQMTLGGIPTAFYKKRKTYTRRAV